MKLTIKNGQTKKVIGRVEHPVVPRAGETVILDGGTEAEVVDVNHVLGREEVIVWVRPGSGILW